MGAFPSPSPSTGLDRDDTPLPLDVTREEIAALFQPFVAQSFKVDDPAWQEEMRRRKRKILKRYLKRCLLGWLPDKRSEEVVLAEYDRAWDGDTYAAYTLEPTLEDVTPWEWHDERMIASTIGAARVRQLLFIRAIERLQPRSVLEVGCGNGANLLLLACRFPSVRFAGVELTSVGHSAAKRFQELPDLPAAMQAYAPLPLADTTAFRRIEFIQGNATSLPFDDDAFDLVFTSLAVEQMERVRHQALREIARVACRNTLMIEPFRDVNSSFWTRLNVRRRDYFRGRIRDLVGLGLKPVTTFDDFPQESFLKAACVLAEKVRGKAASA